MSDSLEGEKTSQGKAFSWRPYVGTGEKMGETEASSFSQNQLLLAFQSVCAESSSAMSAAHGREHGAVYLRAPRTRQSTPGAGSVYSPRNPSRAARVIS